MIYAVQNSSALEAVQQLLNHMDDKIIHNWKKLIVGQVTLKTELYAF